MHSLREPCATATPSSSIQRAKGRPNLPPPIRISARKPQRKQGRTTPVLSWLAAPKGGRTVFHQFRTFRAPRRQSRPTDCCGCTRGRLIRGWATRGGASRCSSRSLRFRCSAPGAWRARASSTAFASPGRAPVVHITAPAGYGKTTAVAEWSRKDGRPFAWYGVDEVDDAADFVGHLATAVSRAVGADETAIRARRPDETIAFLRHAIVSRGRTSSSSSTTSTCCTGRKRLGCSPASPRSCRPARSSF